MPIECMPYRENEVIAANIRTREDDAARAAQSVNLAVTNFVDERTESDLQHLQYCKWKHRVAAVRRNLLGDEDEKRG